MQAADIMNHVYKIKLADIEILTITAVLGLECDARRYMCMIWHNIHHRPFDWAVHWTTINQPLNIRTN
jgi:hypothetical protein